MASKERCEIKRHGGRALDKWTTAATSNDEPTARAEFARLKADMRQGGLQLYVDGKVVDQAFAPRVQRHW
jgi:hypothetical protein